MPTILKTKNSVTTTVAPTSLQQGELAVNITDKKLWVGNAATTPVQLLGTGAAGNFSALTCTTLNASGVVTFTNLTASQAVFTDASDNLVSNAITGTGNVVMSASPTLTGTITAAAITASGAITGNGNWVLGNADTDTITVGASFVTGSVLRSAKLATNTLALAAYDVDGAAYTNLVTLTASNTPTLALTSTGVGTINNMSIGATTASTGAFTTIGATGVATFSAGTVSAPAITTTSDTNTGIFFPAADTIAFTEGGVESMRIDASGNVGIGTSSPSISGGSRKALTLNAPTGQLAIYELGVNGSLAGYLFSNGSETNLTTAGATPLTFGAKGAERMRIDSAGNVGIGINDPQVALDVAGRGRFLQNAAATSGAIVLRQNSGDTVGGYIQWVNNSSVSEKGWLNVDTSSNMIFATVSTERMRIDSSGNLLVGATSTVNGAKVVVSSSVSDFFMRTTNTNATPSGMTIFYSGANPNNTQQEFIYCQDSAIRFTVRSNGGIANYSGNNVNLSDAREKTNVQLANSYLDKICAIPVKTFNYIDQNLEKDDGLTLGVVAQDVQTVAPELIMESNWGTQEEPKMRLSIYQTDLQYALMKCIQELKATVDAQAARIAALESK